MVKKPVYDIPGYIRSGYQLSNYLEVSEFKIKCVIKGELLNFPKPAIIKGHNKVKYYSLSDLHAFKQRVDLKNTVIKGQFSKPQKKDECVEPEIMPLYLSFFGVKNHAALKKYKVATCA